MASAPVFLSHPSSLEHDTTPHPEQPARIPAVECELTRRGWLGYQRARSPAVERSLLTTVHSEPYVAWIERVSAEGGGQLDLDTVVSRGSFEAALHAAGGAVRLVDMVLDGEASTGFSAHRPPGHHATRDHAMGFCLFNNVAVAAQHATGERDLERVVILDWDVHHGNGTNDIFHPSRHVLYISIHQSPLYPGTGSARDVGSGAGRGFTVNLPVPPGSGDEAFRSLVDHVAVPLVHSFEPQLVLISAGYDAHHDDPLASCRVSERGFAAMARSMRDACRSVDAPLGAVLEGGYALDALARSTAATMEALTGSDDPTGSAEPTEMAVQARTRLTEWWPMLAESR